MKLLLLLAATLLLLLGQPASVGASCADLPSSPADELNRSAAVFTGKVVSKRRSFPDGWLENKSLVYFEVDRVWKGVDRKQVVLASWQTSVDFEFEVGERYLVYAGRGDLSGQGNALHATTCGRTSLLADAQDDLRALGRGKAPRESTEQGSASVVLWISILAGLVLTITAVALATIRLRRHTESA